MEELTAENFDEFISEGNAIIDFWAPWCGPCKMMGPEFEETAKEAKDTKFGKVNVDEVQELAQRFQVMSIPTTIFFKNKESIDRVTGALDKDEILSKIKENFS